MAIQTFTHPPGQFQAVQYNGHNLDEVIALVGDDNLTVPFHGDPVIHFEGGASDTLRLGWWVSLRDGCLYVSSHRTGWVPVPSATV